MEERLGRYRLVRKLATGGMAEVFLAVAEGPEGFEKSVVIKRVLPHFAEDGRFIEMFLDEARLAARLDHPNIVQIFDLGQADGRYFLAMEHLKGAPLSRLLKAMRTTDRLMPHGAAAFAVARAATALHHAHRLAGPDGAPLGLVHRDISPDNLFLTTAGVVKILDFGIAKAASNRHETEAGTVKGKFAYMSPEQVRGQPLDGRSDLFSLGVVLYELTTRARPFGGASDILTASAILNDPPPLPTEAFPGYDPELEAICLKCLEKDREARWSTAADLAAALDAYVARTGIATGEAALARFADEVLAAAGEAFSDRSQATPVVPVPPAPPPESPEATLLGAPAPGAAPSPVATPRTPVPVGGHVLSDPPAGAAPPTGSASDRTALLPADPLPAPAARSKALPIGLAAGALLLLAATGTVLALHPWADDLPSPVPAPASSPSSSASPSASPTAPSPVPPPPSPAFLDVRTHSFFQVRVDGRLRSNGSHRMELPPGRHRIEVTGRGFARTEDLDLDAGRERVLEVQPFEGRLVLRASRGTRVLVDGRPVGTAPFPAPVPTWGEGMHQVRFEPPSGAARVRTVVLSPRVPQATAVGP